MYTKTKKALFKVTKKMQKLHKKMLEDNLDQAKTNWTKFIDKQNKLGYMVEPVMRNTAIKGNYVALINMRPMTIEEHDRFLNPKKWEKIDKENYERLVEEQEKNKNNKETKK